MPVLLERRRADDGAPFFARERRLRSVACLEIALVNNMPDAALESTERQFAALLAAAAGDANVRLTLYSLPQVPRSDAGRDRVRRSYADLAALRSNRPDGLIVTGTEPRTPSLMDEPYWRSLTDLIDWAEAGAISSVWSCLSAHAAVLHCDGVARVPLQHKRFGLFDCARAADHPLLEGVPERIPVAHSRWNELPLASLTARGYIVLTRSAEAGVDAFMKQRRSLALYFQGHPEYDARALLREYRRDVGRFLRGERETYPEMPRNYFSARATAELNAYRARALANRREDLLAEFPVAIAEEGLVPRPDSPAACIYRNWLSYLAAQKTMRMRAASVPRTTGRAAAPLAAESVP